MYRTLRNLASSFYAHPYAPASKFFQVYTPLWILLCLCLISIDLASKKWMTDHLYFYLNPSQRSFIPLEPEGPLLALGQAPVASHADLDSSPQDANPSRDYIPVLGPQGKYLKFRLLFNDRFVLGLGPSTPYLGFFLSLFAILFLILYRWYNAHLGSTWAWLGIFSGAFGNLIDKLFIKSLYTREWTLSLTPREGYVSGVVDFVECIWFAWSGFSGYIFPLNFMSLRTWPTFNIADSLIMVSMIFLLLSIRRSRNAQNHQASKNAPKPSRSP